MPDPLSRFWSELKRRRVVRLGIVYLVSAWVVVEVATTIFPPLGIPDWALSLLVVLVILGFPISMTLAWAFDLTSEGVVRTASADSSETGGARVATGVELPSSRDGSSVIATSEAEAPGRATGAVGRSARGDGSRGGTEARAPSRAGEPHEKSVAVLPFVNMSDDRENEYFSDGMTEELLNALVRVPELRVASRTSSFALKGKDLDIRDIADKLRVAHVLEGSVRKAGDRIRVTAQLIAAENGFHLWSDVYDRELKDVFQVQDEIARSIGDALKVQFGEDRGSPVLSHGTENLDAYTAYLKGRFYYNKFTEPDLRRSLELYRSALREDASYARAWAGIADVWMLLADDWIPPNEAYPKAKEAALKALSVDSGLSEANTALGKVLGWYDWDFDAGELALRRAVAANPKYADAHWGLASLLPTNGRLEEAVSEMRTALELDPLSASTSRWLGRFLLYLRRYDEALDQCEHALSLDSQHAHAHLVIGQIHQARGEPERALEAYREGSETGDIAFFGAYIASALVACGREEEARESLARLEGGTEESYVRPEALAMVHGALGNADRAFGLLDEAVAARSAGLIYLHIDPSFDLLKDDPRFERTVRRVGLRAPSGQPPVISGIEP